MPKSDNKHAINMRSSIERYAGSGAAEEFTALFPLSKSADFVKKWKWAGAVCEWLEERFAGDEIQAIRAACCCDPGGRAEKVRALYEASSDMTDFCARFNAAYAPENSISYDGDALFFIYPTCYCSCIKRGGAKISRSWCLCTLGYAQRMFSRALGREVEAQLIESVMTGGERCVMKII